MVSRQHGFGEQIMAMSDAAKQILKESGTPMSVLDIYNKIVEKNPKGVLSQAMRERSTSNKNAKTIMFRLVSPCVYELDK